MENRAVAGTASPRIEWHSIDTVLVDMDGTLLDLAFDNHFWLELVPARYAELERCTAAEARDRLSRRFDAIQGTLNWYCLDHWSRELGFDVKALKHAHRHLVGFLPRAREFLEAVRARGKHLWIVTNAHRDTLAVKTEQTGIDQLVDRVVSSHDFRAPKETREFWTELHRLHPFDPSRTLLIEDSLPVLAAAVSFGIANTFAIRRPDSRRPPRTIDEFAAIDGVADLV
jgi:HAD superfamily hydrolase (TIGR01509 family)